eukprot:TRINITY_DN17272_c0_g1_i2.p1 TRINITY_DN17272_c0_g1~~TRINITY_DN17272_c0_g1_i2.p1  ORF type:complete len:140 (-),score=36.22 TRINITY_DN17272_c0_g1_i2:404-823(-)
MAMSGVTVHDSCIATFEELKRKKAHRYIIFTIENTTTIVIQHKGERTATYDDFIGKFTNDSPAYGVFDFEYETPDGPREKLILISWIPDTSKPRARMLYSSSKVALDNLDSSLLSIQANDASQVAREEVLAKVKANKSA